MYSWSNDLDTDFTSDNSLFGSLKLNKNFYQDKCKYRGYSIGFDFRSQISLPDGGWGKTVITFLS